MDGEKVRQSDILVGEVLGKVEMMDAKLDQALECLNRHELVLAPIPALIATVEEHKPVVRDAKRLMTIIEIGIGRAVIAVMAAVTAFLLYLYSGHRGQ